MSRGPASFAPSAHPQTHSPFANAFRSSPHAGLHAQALYLDNAAATPLCAAAFEAMEPAFFTSFGNPANRLHPMGEHAEHALAAARCTVALAVARAPEEIIFTSCSTEANNLALRGLVGHALRTRSARRTLVVGATEHSSVLATALALAEAHAHEGVAVRTIAVDARGQASVDSARALIDERTLCVALMDVNNETGLLQNGLCEIAAIAHAHGAVFHVDAVQGLARSSVADFARTLEAADTLVVSGAKMHGPKGAAALAVRRRKPRIRLEAQLTGGGHEGDARSGTPNLPAILGFAGALCWYLPRKEAIAAHLAHLEGVFLSEFSSALGATLLPILAGAGAARAPGIVTLHLPGVNAMKLIEEAKSVCVSVGSACRTLQATASHVLLAMGASEEEALASFRVSFGAQNSEGDAHLAARLLAEAAVRVRSYSAVATRV